MKALRKAGFTVRAIWEDLRDGGLKVTHSGFKSALRRIAMERGSQQTNAYSDMLDPAGDPSGAPRRWKQVTLRYSGLSLYSLNDACGGGASLR